MRTVIVVGALAAALQLEGAALPDGAMAQDGQKSVMVLIATRHDAPASTLLDSTIRRDLNETLGSRLDYHAEYLDVLRFAQPDYLPAVRDYLRRKYAAVKFDVVVATSDAVVDFATRYRDELFPGSALVYSSTAPRTIPAATGVLTPFDFKSSLDLAVRLHPDRRQVVVISGLSQADGFYLDLARAQFRPLETTFHFRYLPPMSFSALLREVSQLSADTIVYYLTFYEDAEGSKFTGLESLDEVASVANAPIYVWLDMGVRGGVVGGAVQSVERIAQRMAHQALRVLNGERPDQVPVDENPIVHYFDWRELRRWDIDESLLPAGSIVAYRQPSVWEEYKVYIAGALGLVVLQAVLIGGLLVQRTRRQRTEAALRVSYEENRDLTGRLITAQEAERGRIARDLHDDLSQQLAGLSITVSGLRRRLLTASPADPEVDRTLTSLQTRTSAVAESVRTLSHELHPGVLQHAGLVAALEGLGREVGRDHSIAITISADGDFSVLPPEVSLCLYRVTQEALSNATRHGRARGATIQLRRTTDSVDMTVADDGLGFDSTRVGKAGLGLRSIDERVRIVNGTVKVRSGTGRGTDVIVRIPLATVSTSSPGIPLTAAASQ